jgi:hypothetical protein
MTTSRQMGRQLTLMSPRWHRPEPRGFVRGTPAEPAQIARRLDKALNPLDAGDVLMVAAKHPAQLDRERRFDSRPCAVTLTWAS